MKNILTLIFFITVKSFCYSQTANEYLSLGNSKVDIQDYRGAIKDYTKALELNPKQAKAYYYCGNAKIELKDYCGAINDYTKVIVLDPDQANAYYNRGNAKAELQNYQEAIHNFQSARGLAC